MSEESYLQALARYDSDIRTGSIQFDYRTGQCGPPQATVLKSWGAACPTGFCPPDNLPQALNRWFAGDRAGCRELPYGLNVTVTGAVATDTAWSIERTSKVTMCPTRLLASYDLGTDSGPFVISKIQFGNQNQIVGGPIPINNFHPGAFQPVPFVPDCLKAGQPFSIEGTLKAGAAVASSLYLTFIGPVVG